MLLECSLSMPFLMCRTRRNCSMSMLHSDEKGVRWKVCMEKAEAQDLRTYVGARVILRVRGQGDSTLIISTDDGRCFALVDVEFIQKPS